MASNLGITALSLTGAKGNELMFWIELTNKTAGKRVLSKTGKVKELRQRLAAHYRLDLTSNPETVSACGPLPLDEHIQRHQWDHLRSLGDEWMKATSAGKPFTLCPEPSSKLLLLIRFFDYIYPQQRLCVRSTTPPLQD